MDIQNLTKSYGEHTVFSHFNARLEEGSCTVLMGPSGCGKTTLLRIIMGLEQPDEGTIRSVPKPLSVVFQEDRLLEELTVLENLRAVLGKKRTDADTVRRHLAGVGLEDSLHRKAADLSGGMKRRAALVRACMRDFNLLLLDEPFKGLDEETKKQAVKYVKESIRGKTCIMTTHDPGEAKMMEGRILHL